MSILHTVKLPELGTSIKTVVIIEWLHSVGEHIAVGDPLVLVETDKTTAEVPSPVAGRLIEQTASVDAEIPAGTAFCVIEA